MKDYFIKGFPFEFRRGITTKEIKLNNRFPINIISIQIRSIDDKDVTIVDYFDNPIGYCAGGSITKVIYPNIVVTQDAILKITSGSDTYLRLVGERVAISPDT